MAEEQEWQPEDEDALAKDLKEDEPELSELVEIIDPNEDPDVDKQEPEAAEPEDDPVSARMQKRIDQLTARRHEAERREMAKDQQLQQLQERLNSLESSQDEATVQTFQQQYDQVKQALMTAAEEGDTAKQVALTEQIADMRAAARMAEAARQDTAQAQPQAQTQAHTQDQNQPPAPKPAHDWWDRNPWFMKPEHSAASAFARAVDVQLETEGYDKYSEDYYVELDKRCKAKFPELYKDHVETKAKPPTSPSGGKKRVSKRAKDGRIQLTRDQLHMARELGLTTEAQLKAYAKEIQELG